MVGETFHSCTIEQLHQMECFFYKLALSPISDLPQLEGKMMIVQTEFIDRQSY